MSDNTNKEYIGAIVKARTLAPQKTSSNLARRAIQEIERLTTDPLAGLVVYPKLEKDADGNLSPPPEKTKTVLIVDDEWSIRLFLGEELKEEGYEFVYAGTGKEAIEALLKCPIDLVISDIIHPEIDGIELLHLVKKSWPELPFIFHTAMQSYKQDFATWSADEFIVKSMELADLKLVLKRYLKNSST